MRARVRDVTDSIQVTLYTDPACPWAYSINPALRLLEWRYGAQLDWRLVVIGLSESTAQYTERGYTPLRGALSQIRFRRYGMPMAPQPKSHLGASARACRAIVASGLLEPGSEWRALRALQFATFTTALVLDEDDALTEAFALAPGIDAHAIIALLDSPEVSEAYQRDRAEARGAAGGAAQLQGKTATTAEGTVRYTAPSLVIERDRRRLEAGGFQPVEAYDILLANLDPGLKRRGVPADLGALLDAFPDGLVTQEVAQVLAEGNDPPDRDGAERALVELVASGRAERRSIGDSALWRSRSG